MPKPSKRDQLDPPPEAEVCVTHPDDVGDRRVIKHTEKFSPSHRLGTSIVSAKSRGPKEIKKGLRYCNMKWCSMSHMGQTETNLESSWMSAFTL
jgi:hypothetical protein